MWCCFVYSSSGLIRKPAVAIQPPGDQCCKSDLCDSFGTKSLPDDTRCDIPARLQTPVDLFAGMIDGHVTSLSPFLLHPLPARSLRCRHILWSGVTPKCYLRHARICCSCVFDSSPVYCPCVVSGTSHSSTIGLRNALPITDSIIQVTLRELASRTELLGR